MALAIAASVLVPLIGVLRGRPVRQMLLDGLKVAFATIPEEWPILVTVLVAVGGLRLAKRGVLLRKLGSAEAVGAITVLLTDKTGTLTENQLRIGGPSRLHARALDRRPCGRHRRCADRVVRRSCRDRLDATGESPLALIDKRRVPGLGADRDADRLIVGLTPAAHLLGSRR